MFERGTFGCWIHYCTRVLVEKSVDGTCCDVARRSVPTLYIHDLVKFEFGANVLGDNRKFVDVSEESIHPR